MSATERERLERNFERFQQLSPERQEALLEIEKAVSEDEALNKTLLGYEQWLNTLSPWERSQLRNAKSKEDKLKLVLSITAARKKEAEEFAKSELEWEQAVKDTLQRFQGSERRPEPVRVSDNQLSNMMTALDDYASRVKVSKNALPGCAAYNLQLFAEALKDNIQEVGLNEARQNPLPYQTVRRMIDQITDDKALSHVQEKFEQDGSKGFVLYLAFKLEMAWWHESHQHPPSREELDAVAKTLGGKVLEEYERRKKTDPKGAYFQLLIATRRATFQADAKELSDVLEELELRRFRPNGQSPPGPPNDGPGFRGDNRGPRNDDDDRDRDGRGPRGDDSRRGRD
jgi:hypothetical protein